MGNVILLADKSITIQKIVQLTFADDNYSIHCVADGQAAIDSIHQLHPDLILADISLPLKTGYEVCHSLRTDPALAAYSQTPVILLAGIYETMDDERAKIVEDKVKEVQANDFLSKPFDPQVLVSKVKQYLENAGVAPVSSGDSMFAEPAAVSDGMFGESSESSYAEQPPDDGERTMMIPGGISFANNMFAESLPYEEEPQEASPRAPVDIESIRPEGEPVFDENEFERLSREAEEPLEATQRVDLSAFNIGEFGLRTEPEFEMSENNSDDVPLIIPEAEEPFGEAFASTPAQSSWIAPASEEESPFGLPELPPVEESVEQQTEPEIASMQTPVMESTIEPLEVVHGKVEAGLEPPADFDDTWPGVPQAVPQPVEELFEEPIIATPASSDFEDAEEIEADLSEGKIEPVLEEKTAPQDPVVIASPVVSQPLEITEELIDRIADRVAAKLSERVVSDIVWQVVPDLAERMIRRELEKLHAGEE